MAAPKGTTRSPATGPDLDTYGLRRIAGATQLDYDRIAFKQNIPLERGGLPRAKLFRKIADTMLPGQFEWHDWTHRIVDALCEYPLVAFPGCSGSAKTWNVSSFAAAWWLVRPEISSVTLVTTTRDMLKKRAWPVIREAYCKRRVGNMVDSRMIWQSEKGDDKHAIYGRAVEEGSTARVADNIKGVHTQRQMVIIDEATSVPAAIYEACANLYSYPISCGGEFILVLLGNPLNRLDQFGRFCEPDKGWSSVTVDTGEWEGKPQADLGGLCPHILTFDAEKSPNIVEGRIVSRHLPTPAIVESARKASGGGNTPSYWQNKRGFWPPEGMTKAIFTQSMLQKHNAYGKHLFSGRVFMIVGGFDPARTGDRPALRFAKIGEIEGGMWGIEWTPPIIIPVDATSKEPVFYQLCRQVKHRASRFEIGGVEYSCPPENLTIDATGTGSGCADIFQREWSSRILRVEFGGSPSDDPCTLEDARPASEVYLNKRAEMYYRTQSAILSGQLKGVDRETEAEMCAIEYDDSKRKLKVMDKEQYKEKFHASPDLIDCGVLILEAARIRGFRLAATGETVVKHEEWNQVAESAQKVYWEDNAYASEEDEPDLVEMI